MRDFYPLPAPDMRWVLYPFVALLGLIAIGVAVLALAVAFAWPTLPSLEALTDYHPKIPLRIYTADGELIGEYGEERRAFIRIQDVPPVLKHAILAAEDDRSTSTPVWISPASCAPPAPIWLPAASARVHRPSRCRWRATSS